MSLRLRVESWALEAEKTASSLAQRVNNKSADEEAYSNARGDLDHLRGHTKDDIIQRIALIIGDRRRAVDRLRGIRQLVRHGQAAQQAACRRQTSWNLCEDGRYQRRSCDTMPQTRVQVRQYSDTQGTKGAGDLRAGGEADTTKVIDDVSCKSDDYHDRHLAPLGLVENANADDEEGDEDEPVEAWERILALGLGGGVGVEQSVERRADGDAKAKKERVDDRVHDADGAGDECAGLEFEGGAH